MFANTLIVWSDDEDCFTNGVPMRPEMTLRVTDPLAGLEVGDWRPPSPVLDPPEPSAGLRSEGSDLNSLLMQLQGLV